MSLSKREFRRYMLESFTDPVVLFGNFVFYTLIGLLLAFCYMDDTADKKAVEGFFRLFKYASFAQSAFGSVTNCTRLNEPRLYLLKLNKQRPVNASDTIRNISILSFCSMLFRIFITFWYSLMIYPISGLRGGVERFLVFWLTLFCQTMATMQFNFIISAATSDPSYQMQYASIGFIVVILFSGGYYQEADVSWILRWIQYLSASYYARCALANNEYYDVEISPTLDGNYVLEQKRAIGLGLWGSIGALMGLAAVFFVIAQIVIYFNIKNNIRKLSSQ